MANVIGYPTSTSIEYDTIAIPPMAKVVGYMTTTSKESNILSIPLMSKGVGYLTSYNENPIGYLKDPYK